MNTLSKSFIYLITGLVISVFGVIIMSSSVGAVRYYGPEDTRTRYALEYSPTTNQTSMTIPLYFKSAPTSDVKLKINNFKTYHTRTDIYVKVTDNAKVRTATTLTIKKSRFTYDASSGWYKANINAAMVGHGSSKNATNYIHFRLELVNQGGYVGYGGGGFQQVNKDYYEHTPASNYKLYLATPCTVTSNQQRNLVFRDLDHENIDNGFFSITIRIIDETDGNKVLATRYGDDYRTSMGQGGTLSVPITFKPLHKYRVEINGIAPNNVIRYDFPYDNIAYTIGCNWSLKGTSSVSVNGVAGANKAKAGQVIRWSHALINDGPHYTDEVVKSSINIAGGVGSTVAGWANGMTSANTAKQAGVGTIRTITSSTGNKTQYTPVAADVGKKLCQRLQFDPKASSSSAVAYSTSVCVDIVDSGWSLTPTTTVAGTNTPGSTLTWTHKITNNNTSPEATSGSLTYTGQNQGDLGTNQISSWVRSSSLAIGASEQKSTTRVVLQDDVGKTLCRRTGVTPRSSTNNTTLYSSNACVDIPYSYTLTPNISVDASTIEPGSEIDIKSNISNSGPTKSKNTEWRLTYVTIPSSGAKPGSNSGTQDPCTYYKAAAGAGSACANATLNGTGAAGQVTGNNVIQSGGLNFVSKTAIIGDLPVGTKVCYGLSVKNWSATGAGATQWRHSAVACAVIAKRPMTQVLGGDLFVGRGSSGASFVSTNTKVTGGKQYGSWSEYGIASSGTVTGMASAGGYAGGVAVSNICGVSNLTLGNRLASGSCSQTEVGRYLVGGSAPSVASRFPVNSSTQALSGNQNISSLTAGRVYTASGTTLSLHTAQPVAKGNWYVINAPNATVTISGNINYTNDELDKISDIPQVVIIALNIVIADSVTNVDAWLVATGADSEGRINTCGAGGVGQSTNLNSTRCSNTLKVNGPVIANKLILRRTAGSGTGDASGDPAEVFNLRPDAYLWATSLLNSDTKVRTVINTELPPRY